MKNESNRSTNFEDGSSIAQPKKEVDLESRFSALESKIEDLRQLISQNKNVITRKPVSHIDRLIDFTPTYYVTFVSIIQSAALGLLLLALLDQLSNISKGIFNPIWIILISALFLFIAAIWIAYTRQYVIMTVAPQTLDGIIPFLFGLTQALAIFSIDLNELSWYYFSLTSIALVGVIQYTHTFREARIHYERNKDMLELFGNWDQKAKFMAILRGLIFFSFGVLEALLNLHSLLLAIITLILNVLLIVVLHRSLKKFSEY
jgi:hypothetical protein